MVLLELRRELGEPRAAAFELPGPQVGNGARFVSVRLCGRFDADASPALTTVSVALPALDMLVEWRRCGMTADKSH